jgi:hypothetical protein
MNAQNDEPRFDPRHDPIYQRGYRSDAPRGIDRAPGEDSLSAEVRPGSSTPGLAPLPELPEQSSASARNPYILALWITGVALVAGGVALTWRATATNLSFGFNGLEPVPIEMIIQQITWTIAPVMVSVGALTIVALLFWHAIRWRPGQEKQGQRT